MEPERQCACHADEYAVGYAVGHLDGQAVGRAERDAIKARVVTLEAALTFVIGYVAIPDLPCACDRVHEDGCAVKRLWDAAALAPPRDGGA